MPQKMKKKASQPIEPDNEIEISDSQKKHYAKLGYKPYLSNGGKVKWLSFEQHIYELIKYTGKSKGISLKRVHLRPTKTRKVKYYKLWIRVLQQNLVFILILIGIILLLLNLNDILSLIAKY